ncbi:helix-turn-helix domain-containing protein [Qipengyuania thermophila]|uniref:helix-turn-helix domain-containing protein n=1 Tax=Qipengyuania thermophila TaxID=2509361 RepID=UPI001F4615C7|nr:short-chain fatty acyl-CoA regulator family protein [Qipengyuania thermophila]
MPVYVGGALRRLRRKERLTQAALAARLDISTSYLNLLERNQRPLSTRVLMQLAAEFGFDTSLLEGQGDFGGVDGLARRLADPRFADLALDRSEIEDCVAASPGLAAAFARLFDAGPLPSLSEQAPGGRPPAVARWRNHFPALDDAAERLADALRMSRSDPMGALLDHLRQTHHLLVRILPHEVMAGAVGRLDLHARQLQVSELLGPEERLVEVARAIGRIEHGPAMMSLARGAELDPASMEHAAFLRHLEHYFAAALLMPYRRFLRAADAVSYDLRVLQRRFGVPFSALALRLSSLQRVGEAGLPFFMGRVDAAGQWSKAIAGASAATFIETEPRCPLWVVHQSWRSRGRLLGQRVNLSGVHPSDWVIFSVAEGEEHLPGGAQAVVLGLESRFAKELSPQLLPPEITPAGLGCRRCERSDCLQRSLPHAGNAPPS